MAKYDVFAIGNALVDMEFAIDDDFLHQNNVEKGMMTLVDPARQQELLQALSQVKGRKSCGGSAANTIMALQHFGGQGFYSCKVAKDDTGDIFINDLTGAGVDTNVTDNREEGVSGKCLVMVTPDAERSMLTSLNISEKVGPEDLSEEAIQQAQYVYLEGYLVTSPTGRKAAIEARKLAEKHNVKTAITFSDPGIVAHFKEGLAEMVGEGVDLLFCNEEEAKQWVDTSDLNKAVEELEKIAKTFAITRGGDGALVYDGTTLHKIEPHDVNAIDSNGAGDMFAGAFLYGITNGFDFAKAGRLASLGSAQLVSHFGPRLPAEQHQDILKQFKG